MKLMSSIYVSKTTFPQLFLQKVWTPATSSSSGIAADGQTISMSGRPHFDMQHAGQPRFDIQH